ncbi:MULTISPECIES: ABC transporter ATP-binding protein [Streptomyces]|uniref:ABC transporter ATP-binding protein n=1 Tax=Streptomyces TaxID=1883 RepID=UPI001E4A7A2F|nr:MULTISPECIES: ATP-binding cassette domain-containing protein [Streptomyces]UFQ14138.1 ATP-binding cassette domain-containing protein [Streptomyces huasconensis]WCL83737.1 ATP-binding cassette domain-containing protein [Streptomyces sp. JCM 35825]
MQPPAIEARGLAKSYGKVAVLRGIDLTIAPGTVFALLGPNGAGKTTTVRILATLLTADTGTARVAGRDVRTERSAVRRAISLTGQYAALDEQLTGAENLRLVGRLARLSRAAARARADELLARFRLMDAAGRRVGTYSGGMRRRLDLAASLVGEPGVVFLDEPTTGLDPRSRQEVWDLVSGLADSGVTVFLTTQYLEEADRLADRIALIDGGRIVAEGTAAELKRLVAAERLDLTLTGPEAYATVERLLGHLVVRREPAERSLGVATSGRADHIRELLDTVDPERSLVERFTVHGATLDDVFMTLTDKEPSHV